MSRELTASQHAAIRRQLALIPAYVWSIYIWFVTLSNLPFERLRGTWRVFRDFAHFYVLGSIAARHDASLLHDADAQRAIVRSLGVPDYVDALFAPSYGPQVAIVFRPLAMLSYRDALLVWLALTFALTLCTMYALWRPTVHLRRFAWPFTVLLLAAPALHMALMYGQTSALALSLFVAAYFCAERSKPWLTGLAIGTLFYKPQLGLPAAVLFVGTAQWRVVGGAMAAMIAQLALAWAYWGGDALIAYGRALLAIPATLPAIEPEKQHLHSFRALFQLMGFDDGFVNAATVVASLVALGGGLVVWRRQTSTTRRFAALLVVTALINPHMYVYDLLILLPVCLWLVEEAETVRGSARTEFWWFPAILGALIYLSPLFEAVAVRLRFQPSVLVLGTTLLWLSKKSDSPEEQLTKAR